MTRDERVERAIEYIRSLRPREEARQRAFSLREAQPGDRDLIAHTHEYQYARESEARKSRGKYDREF